MKRTKIVSTLGPASNDVDTIVDLLNSGANVFRFNFSHGDHEEHLSRMNMVREAEKKTGKVAGIMLDTKGAEIRSTVEKGGKLNFKIGDKFRISMDDSLEGTKEKIAVTYPGLYDDVKVGGHVLFDDGLLDAKIIEKDPKNHELVVEVMNNGILGSRKGVNAPGVSINLPGITEKDSDDIRFGCEHGINYIAASFVREPQDVLDIRALLEEKGMQDVQIFPKIESQEGIDNFDEIIKVSDGLMIARGDMGVEIPPQIVPTVQKRLIKICNEIGKPVITATQMLDSMQDEPRPTRAEVSDVANAVYDGTDATMLSGESANGDYPVESVAMMASIDEEADKHFDEFGTPRPVFNDSDVTEALGESVARIAKDMGIHTIVAATGSGYTARMIAKYHPNANILALTFDDRVRRGLTVNWGVLPVLVDKPASAEEMVNLAVAKAVETGLAKEGEEIIVTTGVPLGDEGTTNTIRVQLIGAKLAQGQGIGDETVIGKAVVADDAKEADAKTVDGSVLVVKDTNKDYLPAMKKASAIVVENGGLTSYATVVGISLNIPVIVAANNATKNIKDGELVTVDARRGVVYQGNQSKNE
ncbi:pyruvate kinase [Fructilactobacillus lindneri]|uniref:Pyruvate kinase n=1 Tax=Fructilactobacillus lindneri DSM 20690 = JCM 11027 TaxID=1122148 RepID=A0A0R2JT01_9LACO|nr:pyruvate kinase [Fructilactobacillus lindneri]KRN78966.1 Pyruvate kinase [Fructilactobacillus lindneri DSM 20690 = JCM 11027]POH07620.1 pyruvate kinase [Fructilactobacillus lindneri]POH08281.1 pyruvate kinase [Fructilactobacillus lindneri]POH24793.1 pyruvate kinase [Fructilactobacillus lindneri DSM 20690 = JCM 11027]SJZ78887.1 pyruvate kinase [Fructilactobacillus lindneri DSM 20690 = JCM 11027]